MNTWLIKIGKAYSVLREEGIVRGGRRVFASFFALFHRVKNGDILFISGGIGDSARYRAWHAAEELELNGFRCGITTQDNPFLRKYAKIFSVFVFHRVLYTSSVKKLIEQIKAQNKTIIFETDDLVYDAQYLQHMDMWKKMNIFEKKQYESGVGAQILADPYVKTCTTTTSYLANKLREHGKGVFVVSNKLSQEDVDIAQRISDEKKNTRVSQGVVVIGYFSGTKSHDKDFAVATPALARILERYSNVRLFLAGPLQVGEVLQPFENRIDRMPYVERKDHFGNIAKVDINIAPLEIGNPFCESKSELKFFEAGILGVPTVASATQTFQEAITPGKDGFLAESDQQWEEALAGLVESAKLREKIGTAAYQTTLERYTTKNADNEQYYSFLRQNIDALRM